MTKPDPIANLSADTDPLRAIAREEEIARRRQTVRTYWQPLAVGDAAVPGAIPTTHVHLPYGTLHIVQQSSPFLFSDLRLLVRKPARQQGRALLGDKPGNFRRAETGGQQLICGAHQRLILLRKSSGDSPALRCGPAGFAGAAGACEIGRAHV